MSTPTTPSALWEAIMSGSDYKALMNTHTVQTHTHTQPSLECLTYYVRQERKRSRKKNQYFSRSIFKSCRAADPAATAAARPHSLMLSEKPPRHPPLQVYHLTARRVWASTPPPSPPAPAHLTVTKLKRNTKPSVASRGCRRANSNPSWLTR